MHEHSHRFSYVPGWIDSTGSGATPDAETRRRAAFLRTVPVLSELHEDALWRLARAGTDECRAPGTTVYAPREQDTSNRCYLIRAGGADAMVQDATGSAEFRGGLTVNDWFGDASMLSTLTDDATIVAADSEPLVLVSFDATIVLGVIADHILVSRLRNAQPVHTPGGQIDVRELRLFSDLPMRDLAALMSDAEQHTYTDGATIIRQGDAGDRFHIVIHGDVVVDRDGDTIAYLGPGDYIGETALIFNCPRTATVRAIEQATTWSISRTSFASLVRHYVIDSRRPKDSIARRMRTAV